MSTSRSAAATLAKDARLLYRMLFDRYQEGLTNPQIGVLWRTSRLRGMCPALNILLGQLAARRIAVDPILREQAERVCVQWADQKQGRAA